MSETRTEEGRRKKHEANEGKSFFEKKEKNPCASQTICDFVLSLSLHIVQCRRCWRFSTQLSFFSLFLSIYTNKHRVSHQRSLSRLLFTSQQGIRWWDITKQQRAADDGEDQTREWEKRPGILDTESWRKAFDMWESWCNIGDVIVFVWHRERQTRLVMFLIQHEVFLSLSFFSPESSFRLSHEFSGCSRVRSSPASIFALVLITRDTQRM